MVILLYLATILVVGILVVLVGLGAGGLAGADSLQDMFADGTGLAVLIPLLLLAVVVGCAIYGMFLAVVVAPWAEAYRQLAGRTVDAETFA
jgi:hypothetical protein